MHAGTTSMRARLERALPFARVVVRLWGIRPALHRVSSWTPSPRAPSNESLPIRSRFSCRSLSVVISRLLLDGTSAYPALPRAHTRCSAFMTGSIETHGPPQLSQHSVVGRLDHRYEVVIASQQEDAAAHSAESRRLCRQQAPPRTAAFGRPRIGDGYKKGYKIGLAASGKKTKGPRLRALLK